MAVFEKVQEIIVEELGKDAEEVKLETTFDELDADSLDVFQVISEIEDEFDIQIETEEGLNTVGDLVAYVEEKLNKQGIENILIRDILLCLYNYFDY
ncbi:MAG: acyl carrier protein [Streptococcus sp.]|uniref:acyl carrier protein n=1 Tax=unclassified Streptococcus TaxID=2608887 RepID=UPI00038AF192|nr:Acyl carrier protein [Streptococcus sp. HSISS2]EQC73633.1 Acyl carrier protein [Streptococcus sp. HSISS3]